MLTFYGPAMACRQNLKRPSGEMYQSKVNKPLTSIDSLPLVKGLTGDH